MPDTNPETTIKTGETVPIGGGRWGQGWWWSGNAFIFFAFLISWQCFCCLVSGGTITNVKMKWIHTHFIFIGAKIRLHAKARQNWYDVMAQQCKLFNISNKRTKALIYSESLTFKIFNFQAKRIIYFLINKYSYMIDQLLLSVYEFFELCIFCSFWEKLILWI